MRDLPLLSLCLLLVVWANATPVAADLPRDPMLRVETGMHTGAIKRLALSAHGQTMASASDDKTLRLWSMASGRLIKTLRVPIGLADEGRLWAVAMAPNGAWLATGGYTRGVTQAPGNYHIYLFDGATGDLTQFLSGLPDVVNHLCVSDDGKHLAATFGSGGLRVWSTAQWRQVASDPYYNDASFWCDFSADGHLVTTALDGQVRLYDPAFRLLAKDKPSGGDRPFGVEFSPDGRRIAVGFSDQPEVRVLSAQTLDPVVTPNTQGLGVGDLSTVAWSPDGTRLFAGGRYQTRTGTFPVLLWEQGGAGQRHLWSGTRSNILDLRALPQGGLIVATNGPEWRRYDANGRIQIEKRTVIPDQRDKLGEHFLVSADGRQVSFGLGYGGEDQVLFDLDAKRVFEGKINETWLLQSRLNALGYDPGGIDGLMGPATHGALQAWRADQGLGSGRLDDAARARLGISPLRPARIRAPGLEVKNWKNTTQPTLDHHPLPLLQYEPARSLAVAPDGTSFVLGTGYNLRRLDAEGRDIWTKPVPDTAWGVNLTADGQWVLAALGDGTVRWYRYSDGQELLALFVHKGTRDWVIWTPNGYYDTSPGGDRLIGWHLNRFERGDGLLLLEVMSGSPAQRAGLQAGDVIESINETAMTRREDLLAALAQGSAAQPLTFHLLRDDQALSVKVIPERSEPGGSPRLGAYIGERLAAADAADFYPVANFRDRFYRPDIVAATLATGDETKAIAHLRGRQAGAAQPSVAHSLPPMVQILSPTDGASFEQSTTDLRYRVRNTDQDTLQGVRILVDGRPLDTARGLRRVKPKPSPADHHLYTTEIELPQRDIELTLIAENQFGASPPETITLKWAGKRQIDQGRKPKLYALVAGVSDYDDDRLDLAFAAKDAQDFSEALQRQQGGIYRDIEIRTLTNPDADAFLDGLDWLRAKVTGQDVAILFASGHGVNDRDGDYFYLTRDVDTERLQRTAISQYEIQKILAALPGKVLAFVDTCHSGNVMGARPGVADVTAVVNDLAAAEHGIVVFASSSAKQLSLENAEWGNGAFTKALVEGMDGRRDYEQDGQITVHELQLYLSHRVKELTHNRQTPTTTIPQTITDFPVAITPSIALTASLF